MAATSFKNLKIGERFRFATEPGGEYRKMAARRCINLQTNEPCRIAELHATVMPLPAPPIIAGKGRKWLIAPTNEGQDMNCRQPFEGTQEGCAARMEAAIKGLRAIFPRGEFGCEAETADDLRPEIKLTA